MSFITAEQAREMLGLKTDQTIYRWAKRGWIRKIPLGSRAVRFDQKEISDIAENGLYINTKGKPMAGSPLVSRTRRRKRLWEK